MCLKGALKSCEMLYANDAFGPEESLLTHELYFGPPAYDRPRKASFTVLPEAR